MFDKNDENYVYELVSKNIKRIRKEKGLTQEQLGQLLGVTTQAVSKWERGGTPDA